MYFKLINYIHFCTTFFYENEREHDGEGTSPPRHVEIATTRRRGLLVASKREEEHDEEGQGPPRHIEKERRTRWGIATTRRGGCPPPRCVIGTTWERAPPFPCVAPVRVVRTFFLKKGKFAGAPCTPPLDLLDRLILIASWSWHSGRGCRRVWGWVVVGEEETKKKLKFNLHVTVQSRDSTRVKLDLVISTHGSYYIIGLLLYNILHFMYQKKHKIKEISMV